MTYRTGIIPLDTQLGGGIPEGKIVLILEEPGAGAEVFSYHFAVEGARLGEKVLYIATDDSEEEVRETINLYFNLSNEEWEYITLLSLSSFSKIRNGREYLRRTIYDPLGGIKTIISNEEFNRIIVNNLVHFLKSYELHDVIDFVEFLSGEARKRKFSALLLMTKGMFDPSIEATLKHYVDAVFELSLREVENEVQRRLKVIKFKGIVVPKAILRYDLTDRGVKMESVMRVL